MDDTGCENARVFVEFGAIFWLEVGGQPNARDHSREQKGGGSGCFCLWLCQPQTHPENVQTKRSLKLFTVGI